MKREKPADLQRRWVAEGRKNDLGLWWMARDVRQSLGPRASEDDVRARTLDLLRPLLDAGELRAAGLLPGGKFAEWKGSVEEQLHRIDSDWRALERKPSLGDVVWFIAGARPAGSGARTSGWRILVLSLLCGVVTSVAIFLAEVYAPNSHLKAAVLDALARPGAIILAAVSARWPHTGPGVPGSAQAVLALNFVVYSIAWLAALLVFRPRR